jgi:hypothetical protein
VLWLLIELDELFSQGLVAEAADAVGIALALEAGHLAITPATTTRPFDLLIASLPIANGR